MSTNSEAKINNKSCNCDSCQKTCGGSCTETCNCPCCNICCCKKSCGEPCKSTFSHKRLSKSALGIGFGALWGICLFFTALVAGHYQPWGDYFIKVAGSIYIGYMPGFVGAVKGLIWGVVDGFICGFILALFYNFSVRCRRCFACNCCKDVTCCKCKKSTDIK